MRSEDKYFETVTSDQTWQRYCGFLGLSISEFMNIQKELLMDQIERVADSTLGRKIMGDQKPRSVEDFRQIVPLTTYEDYEPYLSERQEEALAVKPELWCHSSGKGGYFKWIPYTSEFLEVENKRVIGSLILAAARRKGEVNIAPGLRLLQFLPSSPYVSGSMFQSFAQHFSFRNIPPLEAAESMDLAQKIQKGFQIALRDGVDVIGAISSVLVRVGEQFGQQARGTKLSLSMLHPSVLFRLIRAWLRSKKEKRAILPKDLWPSKAIVTGGMDTVIYRRDIAYYWGVEPHESYLCAEGSFIAMQGWNKKGMTFVPDLQFLEFIPYDEQAGQEDDKHHIPSTVLLNEVEEGKLYEIVITQLYGMPLLRYRMKDIIKVISLRDDKLGTNLPQILFQRRVGESINLAGLADLDEKMIWQAIANTGLKYSDWSACKEYDKNQSFVRLYLELKEQREPAEVETLIDQKLKEVDTDYRDIDTYLGLQPVRVTLLAPGTFQKYMDEKRKDGADLAHLKPMHVNPSETVIEHLLQLSESL